MAKSMRSKVKRTFRRSKREAATSAYQITEAARLERLSSRLRAKFEDSPTVENEGEDGEVPLKDLDGEEDMPAGQ